VQTLLYLNRIESKTPHVDLFLFLFDQIELYSVSDDDVDAEYLNLLKRTVPIQQ